MRNAVVAIACLASAASSFAADVRVAADVTRFLSSRSGITFEIRPDHVVNEDTAVIEVALKDKQVLWLQIGLTPQLIQRLPLLASVNPSEFGYFVARKEVGSNELVAIGQPEAAQRLLASEPIQVCGQRTLMAPGTLHLSLEGISVPTQFGLTTTDGDDPPPAKIGFFSTDCALTPDACKVRECKPFFQFFTGECGVGVDIFGGQWCACFI